MQIDTSTLSGKVQAEKRYAEINQHNERVKAGHERSRFNEIKGNIKEAARKVSRETGGSLFFAGFGDNYERIFGHK
jgi:curved DNA-binding protein CbpA